MFSPSADTATSLSPPICGSWAHGAAGPKHGGAARCTRLPSARRLKKPSPEPMLSAVTTSSCPILAMCGARTPRQPLHPLTGFVSAKHSTNVRRFVVLFRVNTYRPPEPPTYTWLLVGSVIALWVTASCAPCGAGRARQRIVVVFVPLKPLTVMQPPAVWPGCRSVPSSARENTAMPPGWLLVT